MAEQIKATSEKTKKRGPFADILNVGNILWAAVIAGNLIVFWYVAAISLKAVPLALLWNAAFLVVGSLAGFLFGVPKIIQADGVAAASSADASTATKNPGVAPVGGVDAPGKGQSYRQRVNTALEDISDWLTKIIVGVGLVEVKQLPEQITRVARFVATSIFAETTLSGAPNLGLGAAIFLFFLITGFLFGFLATRLYLQGAFGRADTAVTKADLVDAVTEGIQRSDAIVGREELKAAFAAEAANKPQLPPT